MQLNERLETRKIVERTIGILIELGFPYQKAFRQLQKLSMEQKRSMRDIAEDILRGKYRENDETI